MVESKANQKQVGGDHYKVEGTQHWDMLLDMGYGHEYYVGQATKYITRWRKKNGVRDIAKGKHFIEKLLEIVESKSPEAGPLWLPMFGYEDDAVVLEIADALNIHLQYYFECNDVDIDSQQICLDVLFANTPRMLRKAIDLCEKLEKAAAVNDKPDAEPPVSQSFKFLRYGDNDNILWECKRCGRALDLGLMQPPNLSHTCAQMPLL